jgi:GT2 family glycosyltransferase
MPVVSALIVNFNSGSHLAHAVRSMAADLADLDWTAVVVDNASEDDSADSIPLEAVERVTVVRNQRNVGFGAAINQAARLTSAPLLWLVNPDCRIVSGAFNTLRRVLIADPRCGLTAPQLLNADGSAQESARGEPTALTGLFGRHGLLTRVFPAAAAARHNLRAREIIAAGAETADVDWVMGACMLIRREAFDRVNGFDERFFLYWEDTDLCRRIREAGFAIRYVPGARVEHPGGASSRTAHWMASRAFHRSAYLYYAKHTAPSRWHPARPFARLALTLRGWLRGAQGPKIL